MIILPTEKRFDWKNPPFILCLLVLLNCAIYLFYQSGDEEKEFSAISLYLDNNLLAYEMESYIAYLKKSGNHELRDELLDEHNTPSRNYFAHLILSDNTFTEQVEKSELYSDSAHRRLLDQRRKAVQILRSTSIARYGLVPSETRITTLFSHQFMHAGVMHLLGNMVFLILCGFAVEAAIGHWQFLLFYLLSGLAGGLLFTAFDAEGTRPLVGASGAISGVMAMYLWVFRLKKIEFFYWFYAFVGYVRLPALMVLPFYLGKELFSYFTDQGSNVAFMAHAGGFLCASGLMAGLLWLRPHTLDEKYIEEDSTINPYQQKLAVVFSAMETGQFATALKRLEEMAAEYRNLFELDLLRYQLLKPQHNEASKQALRKVLSHTKTSTAELGRQERVWLENGESHRDFSDEELVKLGMRFSALERLDSAEAIFSLLTERNSRHNMMGVFARKLALRHEKQQHPEKASRYAAMAESLLLGGPL